MILKPIFYIFTAAKPSGFFAGRNAGKLKQIILKQ